MASIVFRKEKWHALGARNIMGHNLRQKLDGSLLKRQHIDPARSHLNIQELRMPDWQDRIHDMRPRKNAVHLVEWVVGSAEGNRYSLEQAARFRAAACDFFEGVFGQGSVVLSSEHNDETTRHCHITVMPVWQGRLNAKHFLGGAGDVMSRLQTEFVAHMHKAGFLDLERGLEGSEATHQETAQWRAEQKQARMILADTNKTLKKVLEPQYEEWGQLPIIGQYLTPAYHARITSELDELNMAAELSKARSTWTEYERYRQEAEQLKSALAASEARHAAELAEAKAANADLVKGLERKNLKFYDANKELERQVGYLSSELASARGKLDAMTRDLSSARYEVYRLKEQYEPAAVANVVPFPQGQAVRVRQPEPQPIRVDPSMVTPGPRR